jgi:hypothetical protein
MLIPPLHTLLERGSRSLSFTIVSLLERLSKQGERTAAYRICITNVEVETNFMKLCPWWFHRSLNHSTQQPKTKFGPFYPYLKGWLNTVSGSHMSF